MKNVFSFTTLNLIKSVLLSVFFDHPMFCRFELTSKCNFRCEFCHVHRHGGEYADLTTRQVLTVIDALCKAGTSVLYITGGEPLLRDDICEILKYAKQKNMYVLLGTNGSLFKQKAEYISDYIDNIHFSLQSVEQFENITGTAGSNIFNDVIDGIKLAAKLKIPFQVNVTIDKNNLKEMISIARFINSNIGVNAAFGCMELLSPYDKDNKEMSGILPDLYKFSENVEKIKKEFRISNKLQNLIEITKKKYKLNNKELCKAGNNVIVINSIGELIFPCEFLQINRKTISLNGDIKDFLKSAERKKIAKNKNFKKCANCTNSCYLQPSYFLTLKGFFLTLKNMLL